MATSKQVRAVILQELYYTYEIIEAAEKFRDFFKEKYGDAEIECPHIRALFSTLETLESYDTDAEIDRLDK